jgi:hypothetical protein
MTASGLIRAMRFSDRQIGVVLARHAHQDP